MQVHRLDPAYANSDRARDNFHLAVKLAVGFVALLWLVQLSNWALGLGPADLGIRPREWSGLLGVIFAPVLHGGIEHLLANTPPLIVLGTAMLYLYPQSSPRVLPAVYFGAGIAVWLLGRSSMHLGASGLVYGLVSYILVAGLIRRDQRAIAASMMVCFMYGALVWGIFPIESGVSWETHLAAAVIGVVLALRLKHLDVPPRRRYTWEDEHHAVDAEIIDFDPRQGPYGTAVETAPEGSEASAPSAARASTETRV